MMTDVDGALGALGLTLKNLVVASVMSFVALRFFDGLSTMDRWYTFVGGVAIAAWGAAPLREYLELKATLDIGIVIILALFGMAFASEMIKLLRSTDWRGLIERFKPKGGGEK